MASTPPPPMVRAHTPPTPLHGLRYDTYEPYSPRRSKRSTAHSNPYSSFNSDRSPRTVRADASTPPATVKKTRFARAPTHLSSPPSSPASPVRQQSPRQLHKTPRKHAFPSSSRDTGANGAQSDSDGQSHPFTAPTMHPVSMLPTPSKTPKKRQASVASTARILSFQPSDPDDVMPNPRRFTNHRQSRTNRFDLYEDEPSRRTDDNIEIFTDANARIPELDGSEDNPFVGPKKAGRRPHRRGAGVSQAQRERDAKFAEAVANDEGVTYVFRGRKIFRRFEDSPTNHDDDDEQSVADSEVSGSYEQRSLRHQAGAAAHRPLTRSAIKPRLLFPSEEQRAEREQAHADDDDDEEALTDIDMSDADYATLNPPQPSMATPQQKKRSTTAKSLTPPPSTTRSKRAAAAAAAQSPVVADTPVLDADVVDPLSSAPDTFLDKQQQQRAVVNGKKKHSPFDYWHRTKSGSRKRAGETAQEGSASSGKRARSLAPESRVKVN